MSRWAPCKRTLFVRRLRRSSFGIIDRAVTLDHGVDCSPGSDDGVRGRPVGAAPPARILQGVGPEPAPGFVAGHDALRVGAAADDEVGVRRPAGVLPGRLVAQVERPPAPVGDVRHRAVRREAREQDHVAPPALEQHRIHRRHHVRDDHRASLLLMAQVAQLRHAGQDLQAAHLDGAVAERQPAGDHVGALALLHHDCGVLMPRHAVGPATVSELGRRLGAHVLDGVAGDLGANQRFDQVQQALVGQEREHRRGPHLHDVHAVADLAGLPEQQSVAGIERRALAAVGELALRRTARPPAGR